MNEFSLHILDICQNSAKALATIVIIEITEDFGSNAFSFSISDNGKGMNYERLELVRAQMESRRMPSFGSASYNEQGRRGLGLWLLRKYCSDCGGRLELESIPGAGTRVSSTIRRDSPNRLPMGDIDSTLRLMRHMHPNVEFKYLSISLD